MCLGAASTRRFGEERKEWNGEAFTSVFLGQEQRGHRAVCFRDDPELLRRSNRVAAHDPEPVLETQFILGLVFLTEVSPIPAKVT